jgi:20S proteasome alpha/beta subunit
MTMCLAAKAQLGGFPRLVYCCDFLAANDYASYEDVSKYELIGDGLMALYSGPVTTGEELLRLYKNSLKGVALTDDNIFTVLQKPMDEFKERVSRRTINPMSAPQYVDLLIFGFVEATPRIFHVGQEKDLEEEAVYCVIGSGAQAAWAMLDWRGLSSMSRLDEVLYAAYEAMRIAEAGPPVGKKITLLAFLEPAGPSEVKLEVIAHADLPLFAEAFESFGPKPLPPHWHLPGRITGAVARSVPQSTTRDLKSPLPSQE